MCHSSEVRGRLLYLWSTTSAAGPRVPHPEKGSANHNVGRGSCALSRWCRRTGRAEQLPPSHVGVMPGCDRIPFGL